MFNCIENTFKNDYTNNLRIINYSDLQIINDEFNSIDNEFNSKKMNQMIFLRNIKMY